MNPYTRMIRINAIMLIVMAVAAWVLAVALLAVALWVKGDPSEAFKLILPCLFLVMIGCIAMMGGLRGLFL